MPTIQLRTRIDRDLKLKGDAVLKRLGLDASTFVSMSLAQLVNRRGLPFAVTVSDQTYFAEEYGLTPAAAEKTGRRLKRETTRARRSGELREATGPDALAP
jgi:addiction module RelB/DinJ family antitoxin